MTTIDAQCAFPMSQQPMAHTRSQLDIMKLLVRFPLLSVADLAFALGHSVAWTYAQMRALRAAGLVEPTSAPVGGAMCATRPRSNIEGQMTTRVYAATLKGLERLEAASGSAVWRLATETGADSVGLALLRRRLPAVLAVQSFVFALLRQIQQGTVALPRTDPKAERSRSPTQLMWDWVRDPVLRYRWRARSMTVRFDAAVQLRVCLEMDKQGDEENLHRAVPGAAHELAVLYDGGLAEARDLRHTLLQLAQCREALADDGRGRRLPPVLILTPDARRAALWQALALQLTTERWLTHPLLGGAVAWAPECGACACDVRDASDAIWRGYVWRSLAQPTACDLTSLLTVSVSRDLSNGCATFERVVSPTPQRVWRRDGRPEPRKAPHIEALDGLEVTARDLDLLRLLYAHPLLSAEELASLLYVSPASSERYLRRLCEAALVTPRRVALTEPALTLGDAAPSSPIQRRNALSAQGFAVVTMGSQAPGWRRLVRAVGVARSSAPQRVRSERAERYQRYQREVALLARTPDHTAGVYGFFALLHAAARAACQAGYLHALAWWESGRACMRRYRESSGWHAIWPDGAGDYHADGQRVRFWLEWDRGTMGRRDLIAKFAAYARYLLSREWRVDGNDPAPELLIVTSDVTQETRLAAALGMTMPHAPGLSASITSRAALAAQGPLAPIWRQVRLDGSRGHITLSSPCSLISSR
jgi:hypothetical protein